MRLLSICFYARALWLPVDFTGGGETAVPLSGGGGVGFVGLRPYEEECAFSLSTHALDHALGLAEFKRVEPAHGPNDAMSGETSRERIFLLAYRPLCWRSRLILYMTGVLELDLT